jgi:hypothetical protein
MLSLLLPLLFSSSLAVPIQITESASVAWAKQQAFSYVLTKHRNSCRSKQPEHHISSTAFQEKLFDLNRSYTITQLMRLDDSIWTASKQRRVRCTEDKCAFTVEFSKYLLDDFLICEVFPRGDRNFTISEAYVFRLENHKVVLIDQKSINYN